GTRALPRLLRAVLVLEGRRTAERPGLGRGRHLRPQTGRPRGARAPRGGGPPARAHGARPRHLLSAPPPLPALEPGDLHAPRWLGVRRPLRRGAERAAAAPGVARRQAEGDRAQPSLRPPRDGQRLLEARAAPPRLRRGSHHDLATRSEEHTS